MAKFSNVLAMSSRTSHSSLFNICSSCGGLYLEVLLGKQHTIYTKCSQQLIPLIRMYYSSWHLKHYRPQTFVLITPVLSSFMSVPLTHPHPLSQFSLAVCFLLHLYIHIQHSFKQPIYLSIKIWCHYYSLPWSVHFQHLQFEMSICFSYCCLYLLLCTWFSLRWHRNA